MIDIIVVGYPKSGSTWVARLVAELVGCPLVGMLNSDHNGIAREGLDRESNLQCFKSHHQLDELRDIDTNSKKVIYVIRDPRDICISGANYFPIERWPHLRKYFSKRPVTIGTYQKLNKLLISRFSYKMKCMGQAVLFGSSAIHRWVRVPWAAHYKPYLENQYFFVKYEDLLCNAESECKRIITFLGVERQDHQIKDAIHKQSFKNRKEEFIKAGQTRRVKHMRIGKVHQWRQGLPKKQKKMFSDLLAQEFNQLGYPVNDDDL